jgi:hypothetical protein
MYVLLYKQTCFKNNNFNPSIFSVAIYLLEEFEEVFLKYILSGLSPIKKIKHQIDLVHVVVISNHPTYRSNHKKIKEL